MAANPTLVQSNASASSAAAPATYTHNFTQASAAGTLLIALIAYAESGAASITLPAGWVVVASGSSAGNTIGATIAALPNNAGAISSLAITSISGVNGIAVAMFEWSNMAPGGGVSGADGAQTGFSNSSTTPNAASVQPSLGNELFVGLETDLTGQAYTAGNLPAIPSAWQTGPTATSTVGATNAVIRSFYYLPGPVLPPSGNSRAKIAGTLAGALANGAIMAAFISANSAALVNAATGMGTDVMAGSGVSVGGA